MNDILDFSRPFMEYGGQVVGTTLVVFDEDKDQRVVDFVKSLPPTISNNLLFIYEHEGVVSFCWKHSDSARIEGWQIEVGTDIWTIDANLIYAKEDKKVPC